MMGMNGRVRGGPETASAFSQIPSLLQQAGIGAMTEVLQLFSTTLRTRYLRGPYPTEIARHTGGFAATFVRGHRENIFEVKAQGTVITGRFGSTDIRGQVLDEGTGFLPGGVIKPKRGQYLAIPTDLARTSPRGPLKRQYANRSWREVPNTFVQRSKRSGVLFIAEKIPAAGRQRASRFRVLAWLVRQVKIEGRHFMAKTLATIRTEIPGIFQRRLQAPIDRLQATLARIRGR